MKKKTLGIYVHIPFCIQKCAYCDFLSAPATEQVRADYVRALLREIEQEAVFYRNYSVETVFFGGGTPTVLLTTQLEKILCKIKECFSFQAKEVTLECNPGTVTKEDLYALQSAGFNRISLGLQSAQKKELETLGRIHTYETFLEVFHHAREAGFDNINVDIMSALPGQSKKTYLDTLRKVQQLSPEHISAYSLIVEEGTPFYALYHQADVERIRSGQDSHGLLPSEEEERAMYEATKEILGASGYHRYEISNYAKKGRECQHNLVYWKRGNYLGLGLGASSMVDNVRWKKTEKLSTYIDCYTGHAKESRELEREMLSRQEQMEEFMILGLRMTAGISKGEFEEQFAASVYDIYGETLNRYQRLRLLEDKQGYIRLTDAGIDVSNVILSDFI